MDPNTDLHELLPQDKGDTDRAEAIVALGYPDVAPVLPELLEWFQDFNWPVAHALYPLLSEIGLPLLPHVRDILHTDDLVWQYWVLLRIVQPSPPLIAALQEELIRFAEHPTRGEIIEGLDEVAREILQDPARATA